MAECKRELEAAWHKTNDRLKAGRLRGEPLMKAAFSPLPHGFGYVVPYVMEIEVERSIAPGRTTTTDRPGRPQLQLIVKSRESSTVHPTYLLWEGVERCLAQGVPPLDLQSADATVAEDAGVQVVRWDNGVLVVGQRLAAVIEQAPGAAPELKAIQLPEEMPRGHLVWEKTLRSFRCSGTDQVLVLEGQMGISCCDDVSAPDTFWWRRAKDDWMPRGFLHGYVAGCGPGWTLLAHAEQPGDSPAHWRLEYVGDDVPRVIPHLRPVTSGVSCTQLGLADFFATSTGHFIARRTHCADPPDTFWTWRPNRARGRRYNPYAWHPPAQAGSLLCMARSLSEDADPPVFHSGWRRAQLALPAHARQISDGCGDALFIVGEKLVRLRPDRSLAVAPLPEARYARWQRGRRFMGATTPGGDAWVTERVFPFDCAGCPLLSSLRRVKAAAFRPVERGSGFD